MRARSYDAWLADEPQELERPVSSRQHWLDLAKAYDREAEQARKHGNDETAKRWQWMAEGARERAER
jgi:hypothetical protein